MNAFAIFEKNNIISINKSVDFLCSSCQMSKCKKLPFQLLENRNMDVLNKVNCDLWGPLPTLSIISFRF